MRRTLLLPDCSHPDEVGNLEAKSFYPLNNSCTSVGFKHDHRILDTIPGPYTLEWKHRDMQATIDLVCNSWFTHSSNNLNGGLNICKLHIEGMTCISMYTLQRNATFDITGFSVGCHLWKTFSFRSGYQGSHTTSSYQGHLWDIFYRVQHNRWKSIL